MWNRKRKASYVFTALVLQQPLPHLHTHIYTLSSMQLKMRVIDVIKKNTKMCVCNRHQQVCPFSYGSYDFGCHHGFIWYVL